MGKKSLILIIVLVLTASLAFLSYSSQRMKLSGDPTTIINDSLKKTLGIDEEDRSIVSIALDSCHYSIKSIKPYRNRVEVICHVESPDVKSVLGSLANSDENMNQEEFLDAFEMQLSESEILKQDVTVTVVKADDDYIALFDEKAADAFVGGLVAYTEQFIVDMSEER